MRLQALEGWRGLTALLVVVYHLYVAHTFFFAEWLRFCGAVLEFFFIVSGFVMALGFSSKVKDGPSFWGFVVRRLGRVAPMHWAMLGLMLLIPLTRFILNTPGDLFSGKLMLEALPAQFLMLQTWWPEFALSWNHPAWTLSGEVVAYLVMALILLAAIGPRTRWAMALLVLTVASSFFLNRLDDYERYTNVVTISRALTGFFIGFLIHDLWRWFPLRSRMLAHVLELIAVVGFVASLYFHFAGAHYFIYHAIFAFLVYVFAHDLGFFTRIISVKPLLWLGKVSFSIYMFHGVVTTWFMVVVHALEARGFGHFTSQEIGPGGLVLHVVRLPEQWMNDALTLVYVAVVLVGGAIIHRFIEEPSRRYFAKLGDKVAKSRAIAKQPATAGAGS